MKLVAIYEHQPTIRSSGQLRSARVTAQRSGDGKPDRFLGDRIGPNMLFEPRLQGHILGFWRSVPVSTRVTDTEKLLSNGVASIENVIDGHVVTGSKPAIGVAVK